MDDQSGGGGDVGPFLRHEQGICMLMSNRPAAFFPWAANESVHLLCGSPCAGPWCWLSETATVVLVMVLVMEMMVSMLG